MNKFDDMDRQIEELINHELEMQNKLPLAVTHSSDEEHEPEDLYQIVAKRGVGGGLK